MPRAKKPRPAPESPKLPRSFDTQALRDGRRRHNNRIQGAGKFSRDAIDSAVESLLRGQFRPAVQVWRAMRKEPVIFSAALNRLAPHRGLRRDVVPPEGVTLPKGTPANILTEARDNFASEESVALRPGVLSDDFERLFAFGCAVDQVTWEGRADGSREDPIVEPWPMEATEWSENDRLLVAQTTCGRVPVVHGDGRWVVTAKHATDPWTWGAVIPLATLWPSLFAGRRDEAMSRQSHGDDKWIGKLPPGVSLEDPEAASFLDELERLYDFQRAIAIPNGAEVKRDAAMSNNWQIFKEGRASDAKDAQWVLIGQDGTMTNTGGNYVKAWGMFGVRNDFIESDFGALGAAHSSGLMRPWSIINFGRWDRLSLVWQMPDADEDARRESLAGRYDRLNKIIAEMRSSGLVVDQEAVSKLAKELGLDPPRLAPTAAASANQPPAETTAPAGSSDEPATLSINRRALRPV